MMKAIPIAQKTKWRWRSGVTSVAMNAASFLMTLLAAFMGAVAFLWGAWWLGAALVVGCLGVVRRKVRVIIVAIFLAGITAPFSLNQISHRMDTYGALIRGSGPDALTTSDRLSIYFGNIAMGLGGFVIGAPEVAVETLLLIRPNPGEDYLINHSFAMGSPYIRNLVHAFATKVAKGETAMRLKRVPLRWSHVMPNVLFDYRVFLAVAGGGLRAEAHKEIDGYRIDCTVTIDVRYSAKYKLNILNSHGIRLYIDEAIFSALQDLGWLHPYVLHYHWVVITDKHGMVLNS
ncbi:MAG TPA: hypothetical protein EYO02_06915 [Rhodospirillales bacterium]|nr:hypothetical protein [Rhodospirillales bacterium]